MIIYTENAANISPHKPRITPSPHHPITPTFHRYIIDRRTSPSYKFCDMRSYRTTPYLFTFHSYLLLNFSPQGGGKSRPQFFLAAPRPEITPPKAAANHSVWLYISVNILHIFTEMYRNEELFDGELPPNGKNHKIQQQELKL